MASASTDVILTSSNGSTYTLNAYFIENYTSVENNLSNITVRATLTSGNRHWSSSYTSYLRIYWHDNHDNIDRLIATTGATTIANNSSIVAQGSLDVVHNTDGSLSGYAYATWTMGGTSAYCPPSGSVNNGWTALTNIPRFAVMTNAASNLNDESSFWFTYSNPANSTLSCWLEVNPASNHYASRSLSGTSGTYTWTLTETERNQLRAALANSNNGIIRIGLYSTIGGTTQASFIDRSFSIINATPQFSDFTYQDTNSTVTTVTGNNQVFVKGLSTLQATISSANKMVAKKQATAKNYVTTIDNITKTTNYSASDLNINVGTISTAGTKRLNIRAYDSRNNSVLVYKDITVYNYDKPVINATAERLNNFENTTTLKIGGTFSLLTINNVDKNALQTIQYRYRETDGTWENYVTLTPSITNNTYQCSDILLSLDNSKSFEIEVKVTDNLQTTTSVLKVDMGAAVFFISSNQKKCYINNKEVATMDKVNGIELYSDSTGTTGTVNLSENITTSNIDRLKIFAYTLYNNVAYGIVQEFEADLDKKMGLSIKSYDGASNSYFTVEVLTLNNTSISRGSQWKLRIPDLVREADSIYITKVIGYAN